jgi:hypothetical protein
LVVLQINTIPNAVSWNERAKVSFLVPNKKYIFETVRFALVLLQTILIKEYSWQLLLGIGL